MAKTQTKLQTWMERKGWRDDDVATAAGLSRVHINRIRRGMINASVKAALRLQDVTGIRWHIFVGVQDGRAARKPTKRRKRAA